MSIPLLDQSQTLRTGDYVTEAIKAILVLLIREQAYVKQGSILRTLEIGTAQSLVKANNLNINNTSAKIVAQTLQSRNIVTYAVL